MPRITSFSVPVHRRGDYEYVERRAKSVVLERLGDYAEKYNQDHHAFGKGVTDTICSPWCRRAAEYWMYCLRKSLWEPVFSPLSYSNQEFVMWFGENYIISVTEKALSKKLDCKTARALVKRYLKWTYHILFEHDFE